MKRLVALLCMLTCILGLSGCASTPVPTELEQSRGETAKVMATEMVVPYMLSFFDDARADEFLDNYNVHDMEYIVENEIAYAINIFTNVYGLSYDFSTVEFEGNAIMNGITSFNNTYDSLGEVDLTNGLEATYELSNDKKTIIVTVPVTGSLTDDNGNLRTAEAEIIFSNDVYLTVESCTLNLNQSMGELMTKAAMDTLMGMGTVFVILILISLLIWAMGGIPKIQEKFSKKNKEEAENDKTNAVDNTIAQIIEKEESLETDDLELIAVIAAAIAASEGAASTDGFVVRSIRKRR